MKRMAGLALFFLCFGGTSAAVAQDARDEQTRLVVHLNADLDEHWFLTSWTIQNVKLESPNNINLFEGVGYRRASWWLESMVQRQWGSTGDQVLLDFRFQTEVGKRGTLFAEVSPFLTKHATYDFVTFDYAAWKKLDLEPKEGEAPWRKLSIGAETENVHKAGRDSLGAGPRVSYPLGSIGGTKIAAAFVYQFRRQEPDVPRLYVVFNHRFSSR